MPAHAEQNILRKTPADSTPMDNAFRGNAIPDWFKVSYPVPDHIIPES